MEWGSRVRGTCALLPCQLLLLKGSIRDGLNSSSQPDYNALLSYFVLSWTNDLCFLEPVAWFWRKTHGQSWPGKTLGAAISYRRLWSLRSPDWWSIYKYKCVQRWGVPQSCYLAMEQEGAFLRKARCTDILLYLMPSGHSNQTADCCSATMAPKWERTSG